MKDDSKNLALQKLSLKPIPLTNQEILGKS